MSDESAMLLLGIGTAGSAIARGVGRAFGGGLRLVIADTDASTGEAGGPFTLLGGDRLSGRGAAWVLLFGLFWLCMYFMATAAGDPFLYFSF